MTPTHSAETAPRPVYASDSEAFASDGSLDARIGGWLQRNISTCVIAMILAFQAVFLLLAGLVSSAPSVSWIVSAVIFVVCSPLLFLRRRAEMWRWLLPLVMLLSYGTFPFGEIALASYAARQRRRATSVLWLLITFGFHVTVNAVLYFFGGEREAVRRELASGGTPAGWRFELAAGAVYEFVVLLMLALSMAAGMYILARRERAEAILDQIRSAEERGIANAEQARASERTRIAREMHDIVAHKISLIALQAGALEVNAQLRPEEVERTSAVIRSTANEALTELRQVLGVLRSSDGSAPLAPQPTWGDVLGLIEASRAAGIDITLEDHLADHVDPEQIPELLARSAYRVMQECLTNIHKHARTQSACITIDGVAGQQLELTVLNDVHIDGQSRLPGAKMGLIGIQERVHHAGGTLDAGESEPGTFRVHAILPWTQPSAT